MNAEVARIMAKVCGFPEEGHEHDLDPEYAVFGRENEVLQRGIADEYAADEAAAVWRTTYYRPDAWSGRLCSDYRDHPRESCATSPDRPRPAFGPGPHPPPPTAPPTCRGARHGRRNSRPRQVDR